MKIGNRIIGEGHLPLIICELGINHQGSLSLAKKMVDLAYKSGAEAIKNQSHILDKEMIPDAKKIKPSNANTSIYNVIKKNLMSFEDELKLKKYIEEKKMIYLSTPFSLEAAIKLNKINIKAFKIGSGECNNLPLIEKIAEFKKPIILSTGMNDLKSIRQSVNILKKKNINFALLHCKSEYPAKYDGLSLDFINVLKKEFKDSVIGYSDHSEGIIPCISAMAKGANIVEKHFTDTKKRKGPDIICSMDPSEFKAIKEASKIIFKSNGKNKKISKIEKITARFAFSSVVSIQDIKKGQRLNKNNIWVKRPGNGNFLASSYNQLIGKKTKRFIKRDNFIKKNDI
jgi:sialic acid synthase SpsE